MSGKNVDPIDVPMFAQNEVKQYMRECLLHGDCTDAAGLPNATMLAEAACDDFDAWDEDDDVPALFFDLAHQVIDEIQPKLFEVTQ